MYALIRLEEGQFLVLIAVTQIGGGHVDGGGLCVAPGVRGIRGRRRPSYRRSRFEHS